MIEKKHSITNSIPVAVAAQYPRVEPANYYATCVGKQGPALCKRWGRWSLRLEFVLLDTGDAVSMFLNLNDAKRPHGQNSALYRAWTVAKGRRPNPGEPMDPEVFVNPRLQYKIRIVDSTGSASGGTKPEALIYSRVAEILSVTGHEIN